MMNLGKKRGQITVFVIIGIVIVLAVVIFLLVWNNVVPFPGVRPSGETDYRSSLAKCIEESEEIDEKVLMITKQGGSYNPQFYYEYKGNKYEYLCYIGTYYETCIMQKPFLIADTEKEIKEQIESDVRKCITETNEELEEEGYNVNQGRFEFNVDFVIDNLVINVNPAVSISRDEERRSYREEIEVRKPSQLYKLMSISTSIVNQETSLGDSDPLSYMVAYPEVRVEKNKQGDGSTLYFLKDRNTEEEFNFAVRSLAWPPGYGW
jgi:hypothetical protein